MKVNGYQIREAIKRWTLQRDTVSSQFEDSLHAFADEQKVDPMVIMAEYSKADQAVARLEEIQQRYNHIVQVNVLEQKFTLSLAVKFVGGAGRREKMWRSACFKKRDRWSRDEISRSLESEYAKPTISTEEALEQSKEASRYASALRSAIAKGNNSEVDVESISMHVAEFDVLFN